MRDVRVLGTLDPSSAWDGTDLLGDDAWAADELPSIVFGGIASVVDRVSGWRFVRDPLGINKLFWAEEVDGDVVVAASPKRLVDEGIPFSNVRALPSGTVVDITNSDVRHRSIALGTAGEGDGSSDPSEVGHHIRERVERYLASVSSTYRGAPAFVCLSGGLDSSAIAAMAREIFPDLIAVSFDLEAGDGSHSEDRLAAERLARDFRLPLIRATATPEQLLERIDAVLIDGVDWRDFNVHAALVNAVLADEIVATTGPAEARTPVLTGDLANEFLVDYHEERHRGAAYYELPRLDARALRRFLVRGLDTSHREVGIFAARDLCTIQPYAVAADEFLHLDPDFLAIADRKELLYREMVGGRIPRYIYARKKVRAQMGSATGGGVLSVCVDRGIDDRWLRERFAALHRTDPAGLHRFIRSGVYHSGIPFGRG